MGVLDCESGKDYVFANDYDIDDVIWSGPLPSVKELAASVGVANSGDLCALQTLCTKTIGEARKIHYLPPYRADNTRQMSQLLGIKFDAVTRYASMELDCRNRESYRHRIQYAYLRYEDGYAWTL